MKAGSLEAAGAHVTVEQYMGVLPGGRKYSDLDILYTFGFNIHD